MRVFYISYFFRPVITPEAVVAYRVFKQLKEGKDLSVYALTPGKNLCTGKIDTSIGFELDPNVIYLDTKRPIKSKVLKGLIFYFKALLYMQKNNVRSAVIFSRSTPLISHVPALFVRKKKWIVSFSDPPGEGLSAKLLGLLVHGSISRNADCIVVPSQRMQSYYQGFRTLYLPHFAEPEQKDKTIHHLNDSVNYYHFGNLYGSRDCRPFLEALRTAYQGQGTCAKLIVYGLVSEEICEGITKSNLQPYIEVRGYINHSDYIGLLKHVRNTILFDMNVPASPYMPSKLVEYLEYGIDITVVTTKESEVEAIAQEHGIRLIYYSEDIDAYIAKLRVASDRKPNKFNSSSDFMQARIEELCEELRT